MIIVISKYTIDSKFEGIPGLPHSVTDNHKICN